MSEKPYLVVDADDFARHFSMRSGGLMWLLGTGASASARFPTALDMIWEFKQQLYVSQRRVALESVEDLSNPASFRISSPAKKLFLMLMRRKNMRPYSRSSTLAKQIGGHISTQKIGGAKWLCPFVWISSAVSK